MLQSAKSNTVQKPLAVAVACLTAGYAMAACGNSSSVAPAPVVASGGAGTGGATQAQNGGASQSATGGASQSATGGASQTATGGASQTATGGASQTAGGTAAGGDSQAGGTPGAAGATDPCAAKTCASTANCTASPATQALISDFASNSGDFKSADAEWWTKLFGATFVYPALDACVATQPSFPLTQNFSDASWHVTGTVGTYSGLGIWLAPCMADLSAYKGISFKISGNVGPKGTLIMGVATAGTSKATTTTCSPNTATCVDGTTDATKCAGATKTITVTSAVQTISVLWTDFIGGYPETSPVANSIVGLSWTLDWVWNNTAANNYAVDFVIDDITLVP